ncbi:MAG: UDP-glucose/GDP-mannose dehydrogenase family protein, partial [Anaerolineae bacterium]|nr:UDP-glucose/GDP-mannose dehydrogenase family protein [Anaerolineae bacterium]
MMEICVVGLWHLGMVTAACMAKIGHHVTGYDADKDLIEKLQAGETPLFEPGLKDLIQAGITTGNLQFSAEAAAVAQAELVWVTYDTPVDENDVADVDFVVDQVTHLLPFMRQDTLVLISSQLPVGTTARLEAAYHTANPNGSITFAYSPENLRLGNAIRVFMEPDRIIIGIRHETDKVRIAEALKPITNNIEWMSAESAEMTKHALNAFLATSVAFMNEIATLCEQVGADAREVERGLKSEVRIGPRAYLRPGGAFAGGTLARDLVFLS